MNRTCLKCGWVHYGVPRKMAEEQVKRFNKWFDEQPEETRQAYGGLRSDIKEYEFCDLCRAYCTEFRDAKEDDCPEGCTLSPIIVEDEE